MARNLGFENLRPGESGFHRENMAGITLDHMQNKEEETRERIGDRLSSILRGIDRDRAFVIAVFLLIFAYACFFSIVSIMRYSNYRASGVDVAIFNQALWKMSRIKVPWSTIRGVNLFGDHFAPFLVLLVPFYRIFGGVKFLFVFQTLVIALGALPLYLLSYEMSKSRIISFCVALSYLSYPPLQHMNLFDFHPEACAVTFLIFAFYAAFKKRFGWFYCACFLAVICKEDMALTVFFLGILIFILYDKRAGKIVSFSSLCYFLAAVLVVIPAFGREGFQYTGRLSAFGRSPLEAAKNMILRPLYTLDYIITRQNLKYILDILVPVAFVPLLAPLYLLPALPAFLINIISDFPEQRTILYQYTAGITPFIFIGLAASASRILDMFAGARRRRALTVTFACFLLLFAFAGSVYFGPGPLGLDWSFSKYRSDKQVEIIRKAARMIPEDASVSAQIYLLPHLSGRDHIYMFPNPFIDFVDREYLLSLPREQRRFMFPLIYRRIEPGARKSDYHVPDVEYVVVARGVDPWPLTKIEYERVIERLEKNPGFKPIFSKSGVLVFKKQKS